MSKKTIQKVFTWLVAIVWIVNGLFSKVLNLVPRHQLIVSRILGEEYSMPLTKMIGAAEIVMAIWILSEIKKRLNAVAQIIVILLMNTIEFITVPELLLFGRANSIFALVFVFVIYYNEFVLNKASTQPT